MAHCNKARVPAYLERKHLAVGGNQPVEVAWSGFACRPGTLGCLQDRSLVDPKQLKEAAGQGGEAVQPYTVVQLLDPAAGPQLVTAATAAPAARIATAATAAAAPGIVTAAGSVSAAAAASAPSAVTAASLVLLLLLLLGSGLLSC